MRPRLTLAALALAATPALAFAQDATIEEAARSYVDSIAMQSALDQLLSTDAFVAQVQAGGMPLDDESTSTLTSIVDEEFQDVRPELEEAMTAAAAEAFTLEELEALNTFYESAEGQAIAAKMGPFMQEFYADATPALRETQEKIVTRARDALAPEGTAPEGTAPSTATE